MWEPRRGGGTRGSPMKTFQALAVAAMAGMIALFLVALVSYEDGVQTKSGRALSDLQTLEQALRKVAAEENFTAAEWDKIDMATVGPHLAACLDQGKEGLIDPWREPYILEKSDEGDLIVVTLRSNHMLRRKWYQKDKVIGFELVISRADGRVVGRRELWR